MCRKTLGKPFHYAFGVSTNLFETSPPSRLVFAILSSDFILLKLTMRHSTTLAHLFVTPLRALTSISHSIAIALSKSPLNHSQQDFWVLDQTEKYRFKVVEIITWPSYPRTHLDRTLNHPTRFSSIFRLISHRAQLIHILPPRTDHVTLHVNRSALLPGKFTELRPWSPRPFLIVPTGGHNCHQSPSQTSDASVPTSLCSLDSLSVPFPSGEPY